MRGAIVQTESLTQRFGARTALDRVTLSVDGESLFALLGPNGGGKTTMFRILATLLSPSEGTASVAGFDVLRQRDEVSRRIGVVFQHPSLDRKLTVLENLTHQGHLYGLCGRELRDRCQALLNRFDIADRASEKAEQLSGGLQRRVELAKSMLHKPQVLILDEPSTGLDPTARVLLLDVLRNLCSQDGVTTLLTTHFMDEADRCDQVAILDAGRLVRCDTPANLKAQIGGDVLTIQTPDASRLTARLRERFSVQGIVLNGLVRLEKERGHEFVTDLIESFPGEIDSVTVGRPTLEDVFLQLTGHRLHQNWVSRQDVYQG